MDNDLSTTRDTLNRQLGEAVTADPLEALSVVGALDRDIAGHRRAGVRSAIQHHTWAEIGEALGVTRQAAHQKFAKEWAETLKAELKAETAGLKTAKREGDEERAAESKARLDALIAEFKGAGRRRKERAA